MRCSLDRRVLDNLEIRQALLREVEACLALVQDRMLADLNTSAWRTANPDQIIQDTRSTQYREALLKKLGIPYGLSDR
jgi:hypothetical protein